MDQVQEKTAKMMDWCICPRSWKSWDCSAWGQGMLRRDLTNVYKYLMGGAEEQGIRLLVVPTCRTRGNEHNLKSMRFYLSIRRHFFFL